MTNAQRVTEWMREVGQPVPEIAGDPGDQVLQLRTRLIEEESLEVWGALCHYRADPSPEHLIKVLKEGADVLVVTYGLFTALGVDADLVFGIVQDGNDRKIADRTTRGDGKIESPYKAEINAEVERQLSIITGG